MTRESKSMDGNNAAAYVSYAFTEVAGIYPITPSSPMADFVDPCGRPREEEHFRHDGQSCARCNRRAELRVRCRFARCSALGPPRIRRSQGLLLMIPNM